MSCKKEAKIFLLLIDHQLNHQEKVSDQGHHKNREMSYKH